MSVNSSSSSNATLPPSNPSPSDSLLSLMQECTFSTVGFFQITALPIISILLVFPLCIFVLYLGLQQWRQRRSGTTMSHSDVFTYHMVAAELMGILGSTLTCFGVHTNLFLMTTLGTFLSFVNINAQLLFHILTCVERYLAVVHPVIYLSLKKAKGIRMRNITIGCGWLMCFAAILILLMDDRKATNILSYCNLSFLFIVICFCSLSVLRVLIRPGPGDGGGDRQRVDQSKLRAFYTIMAILAVLLLRLGGSTFVTVLYISEELTAGEAEKCYGWSSVAWFSLPSSLVLPLLYLQRAGKLVCCRNNKTSRPGSD